MLERQRGVTKNKGRAAAARGESERGFSYTQQERAPSEIAGEVGISRASVYRILAEV
jgi:hypothetical protein